MNIRSHPFKRTEEVAPMSSQDNTTPTNPEEMTPEQRQHLVRLIADNPEAGQVLTNQLAEQGYALTANGEIVKVKKTVNIRKAAAEGEDAGEAALESVKDFFHTVGERTTLALVDLPKEKIARRKAEFHKNHAERLARHRTRKAEARQRRAKERAEREAARAKKEAEEAAEAAERANKAAQEAGLDPLPPV